ncbi:UNVERIFIED_CONTAM: hypothetical protein NY603_29055, partial [Bacteroidetes bacterium 56_B9]
HQADNVMSVIIQPKKWHKREKVAEVKRRSGGIYAGIETYFAGFEEFVESIAVTETYLSL